MKHILFFLSICVLTLVACKKNTSAPPPRVIDSSYKPDIRPARFTSSTNITNPYYPITAGKKYIYEGQTPDGLEHVEEQRLTTTKTILGIICIVVNFKSYLNGKLIEEAQDWYAQDNEGNLWYFGEAVDNYNTNGTLKDHKGSWEAGVGGALPGIAMLASPQAGIAYREEYFFNNAEDRAQVLETGISVTIPLGTYTNCIKTKNWTELEPDVLENKFYAPGIGLVKDIDLKDNSTVVLKAIL